MTYAKFIRARRELARAVRRAYRLHGSVRAAAKALGMPRSTFHEYLTRGAP
jgi:DNA-binding IclR family transcriptional regulator